MYISSDRSRRLTQRHDGIEPVKNDQQGSLWVCCPICGGKTRTKIFADTVLVKFPLYCPKCKKEIRVDVVQLKMVVNKEPDT